VQVGAVVAPQLDSQHGASHTSFILRTVKPPPPGTGSPIDDAAEALFEEARQRARRRRRRRLAVAAAAVLAIAAAVALAPRTDDRARQAPKLRAAPAARLLAERGVYMGVACELPNSIACDRVGIAVWTRRPARGVVAVVGGRSVALDDREWSRPTRRGLRRMFAGFLKPAGMLGRGPLAVAAEDRRLDAYTGRNLVSAPVRLVVTRADGSRVRTSVRAQLSPGWG
jgi:hypothetical protein